MGRDEALGVLEAGRRARMEYRLLMRMEDGEARREGIQKALAQVEAAREMVDGLEDLGERAVLRLRYLEGRRWPEVFSEMEKLGLYYCERHIYRIHARALERAGH